MAEISSNPISHASSHLHDYAHKSTVRPLQCCTFKVKIHYTRFSVTSLQTGKLPTCHALVADLLATWHKSATSRCSGIWETTRHDRHNGLLPAPTCYGLVIYVADLLWTCYGETSVMDFGLYAQNPLHTFPRNLPVDEEAANLLQAC